MDWTLQRMRIFFLLFVILSGFRFLESASISRQKQLMKVAKKLIPRKIKKLAVKSILSEDGDVIDCIDIYRQPAFHHRVLRNHTIQMVPSFTDPTTAGEMEASTEQKKRESAVTVTSQLWQRSGRCPKGTIPIRRTPRKERMFQSNARMNPRFSKRYENSDMQLQLKNHSLAMLITAGYRYLGAKGDIKVWNPFVESDDDYSTSRVALKSGPFRNYEAVESGWAVNPRVYGDRQTRLYVYWTTDSGKKTGCFDLTCPGFVQTSSEIALGAAIYPISVPQGLPYQITLYVFKDPRTNNWWVQYGERINIGYWPPDLFGMLSYHAETVQWGGEVYSPRAGMHPHTATAMGNGNFPDYIFGNSGWVKRMRVKQNAPGLRFPDWVDTFADEYDCYGVWYVGDYVDDPEFYFGGPGRSYRCP
ncbi:uncharacterized protein LOC127786813 [Diospyros lotus]|uniref:uncharacterized protein LOC127786813 n=1 Tax=Diospyros lotus TaxID=55363 RepID=UPI00225605B8|nr:uncharacterized protein LOC127786813 [Diospyros lotus]